MEIENLDENAAWHKVFTSGSEALKSKLKKVHAKNPKFQAFLKSGGYEGEQKSAAQAKKDVAVINKAKAKAAEPKKVDRIELIRRAVEKRNARNKEFKLRRAFGGEPLGAEHDNPISMARAGMPIKGYRLGEEMDAKEKRIANLKRQLIKGVASKGKSRETATAYASMPSAHSRSQAAGHAADLKRDLQSKYSKQFAESHEPMKPYVKRAQQKFDAERRAQELEDRAKKRQAGTSYGLYLAAAKKAKLKEGRMKDIATDREETSRLKAQEVLGGPVVAKSTLPAGKRPAGQRRARSLARAALKNLLVKRKGK
jgi:hypothetical protein